MMPYDQWRAEVERLMQKTFGKGFYDKHHELFDQAYGTGLAPEQLIEVVRLGLELREARSRLN